MIHRITQSLLALLLCSLVPTLAQAGAMERLQQFHREVQNFEATFDQSVVGPEGEVLQQSSGDVWLQRPNRFRWDYRQPYPQLIVGDGDRVWIYDSELEQVTVKALDHAVGSAPALVLSGGRELTEKFQLRELPARDGLQWVELTPAEAQADFQRVEIGFGDALQSMVLHDNFGQTTRIQFHDVRVNQTLEPTLFRFEVPDGADVVGELR